MRVESFRTIIWQQFGAAIEMVERSIRACPEAVWGDRSQRPEYWYVVYHTLFFLDLYLSDSRKGFTPPSPYNLNELDPAGALPDRVYTKEELLSYLEHGRRKCEQRIATLTDENENQVCPFGWTDMTRTEALLYNMRHVQHHAGQLYLLLRQRIDSTPGWVDKA
jgi:hypothetical protein